MSKNPYGYSGGRISTPQERARQRDGLSREQLFDQERLGKVERSRRQNFDNRFGGPVFKTEKKSKWYQRLLNRAFAGKNSPLWWGLGLACIAWGPVYWHSINRDSTPQQNADRDILIRKAFEIHGDKWYSVFLPYKRRYKEILKEDWNNERKREGGQE